MGTRLTEEQRGIIRETVATGRLYGDAARLANCPLGTAKSYGRSLALDLPRTRLWAKRRELNPRGMGYCPRCERELPLTLFRLKAGVIAYTYCLECCAAIEKERQETPVHRFNRMASASRFRTLTKGIPHTITAADLADLWEEQGGRCAYSGEPLTLKSGLPHTISLDRKVPSLGYVRENVVLCCDVVNKMKWEMTPEEMVTWSKRIVAHAEATR